MRALLTISLFLCCLTCLAQLPMLSGAVDIQYPASSIDFATNQGNARFYWNWNDLTDGITVSNQFSDRIQGVHMWQMNTAKSPTNSSANGIRFNGAASLTNINFSYGVGTFQVGTIFFVFSEENQSQFPTFSASDTSGADACWVDTGGVTYDGQNMSGPVTQGAYKDVLFTQTNGTIVCYTNGQQARTRNISSMTQAVVGNTGGDVFKGWWNIEICYCNILASASISNLHWWRTNPPPLGLGLGGPP